MNHSEERLSEARRQHTEAVVARYLYQLFQRHPEAVPLMRGRTFARRVH